MKRPVCLACFSEPITSGYVEELGGSLCMGDLGEYHAWLTYGDEAETTHDWAALLAREER
jgi:hypothetical protein